LPDHPISRLPDHPIPLTALLLSIGDELLIGQVVNTNAAWLGQRLGEAGVSVAAGEVIADDVDAIGGAVRRAVAAGANVVVLTGGLGPTHDDLTVEALARALERSLRFDDGAFEAAAQKIRARGRDVTDRHRRLGMVPEGFEALPNPRGLAPGLWGEVDGTIVVAMPGVPYEMQAITEAHVLPRLRERAGDDAVLHHTFQTVGEGETALAARIGDVQALAPGHHTVDLRLAFLPALGTVRVRLSARGPEAGARRVLATAADRVRAALGPALFAEGDASLEAVLGQRLLDQALHIGIAESCTGGAVLARLTSVPGASRYVLGGIVAYGNRAKEALLGVPGDLIRHHGAVSEAVALANQHCAGIDASA
jgi:nicotinamide-nucleotide amidase